MPEKMEMHVHLFRMVILPRCVRVVGLGVPMGEGAQCGGEGFWTGAGGGASTGVGIGALTGAGIGAFR